MAAYISQWTPAALFAQGQQGVWYEPKPQYLYQDAAGTVPVAADGDPVGWMRDLSGNGNHATQSTSTSRPIYRTDGVLHWIEFDGVDDYMNMSVPVREVLFGIAARVLSGPGTDTRAIVSPDSSNYFAYNGTALRLFDNESELGTLVRTPDNSIELDVAFSSAHRIEDTYTDITLAGETYSFSKSVPAGSRTHQFLGSFNATFAFAKIDLYSAIIVDGSADDSNRDRVINYGNSLAGITL